MKKFIFLFLSFYILTSNPIKVYAQVVNPIPGVINTLDNKNFYCYGQTVNLVITGYSGTLMMQESTDNINYYTISNSSQFSLVKNGSAKTVYYYRSKVAGTKSIVYSQPIQITFFKNTNNPSISFNFPTGTKCGSTDANVSLSYNGEIESIQWFRSYDNVNYLSIPNNSVTYPNAILLTDNEGIPVQESQKRYYKAKAKIYTCNGLVDVETPQAFALSMDPAPMGGILTADKTNVCAGETIVLNLSQFRGTIYWEVSTNGGASFNSNIPSNASTVSYLANNYTQPNVIRARLMSGSCPSVYSNQVTINVNKVESIYPIIPSQTETKCANSVLSLSVNNPLNAQLQWLSSLDGVNYTPIDGAVSPNYTEQLVNNGTTTINKYYKVQFGTVCPRTNSAKLVQIAPAPIAGNIVGPNGFCGSSSYYTLSLQNYFGSFWQWEYQEQGSSTWVVANQNNQTTINVSMKKSLKWRVRVFASPCTDVYTPEFNVIYYPAPGSLSIIPNSNCNQSVWGTPLTINAQGNFSEYEWQIQYPNSTDFVSLGTTTVPQIIIPSLPNSTKYPLQYQIRVIGKPIACSPVMSLPQTFTIFPDASVVYLRPQDKICLGSTYTLNIPTYGYNNVEVSYKDFSSTTWYTLNGSNDLFTLPAFTDPVGRAVNVTFIYHGCERDITSSYRFNIFTNVPDITILGDDNFCKGKSDASYLIDNPDPNIYYNWTITPANAGFFQRTYVANAVAYFTPEYIGTTASVNVSYVDQCGVNQTVSKEIHLIELPQVSMTDVPDKYCGYMQPIELQGQPAGGTFVGDYFENQNIWPGKIMFAGSERRYYAVGYTVTDPNTHCSNTAYDGMDYYPTNRYSVYNTPPSVVPEGYYINMYAYPESNYQEVLQWQYKAPGDTDWNLLVQDSYHYYISTSNNELHMAFVADLAHSGYTYRGVIIDNCGNVSVSTSPYTITVQPSGARLTGVSDLNNQNIAIYPNPSADKFSVQVAGMEENFKLSISDLQGKVVFEKSYSYPDVSNLGSDLSEGTYIITVSDSKSKKQELFVKTK